MTHTIYKKLIAFVVVLLGVSFAVPVFASNISFAVQDTNVYENQNIHVTILLDTQGEDINTISADIMLPNGLTFVQSDDSNSIIHEWVEQPVLSPDGHTLHFAGIIPGGFAGYIDPFSQSKRKPGELLTLVLHTGIAGTPTILTTNAHVYKNDGLGTEDSLSLSSLPVNIQHGVGITSQNISDTEPPLSFVPVLTHDPLLYDGKYVVVFSTKDIGSGIDHYEVKEGASDWITATSPYLLKDQKLSGQVFIKAVDHAGNVQIQSVALPIIAINTNQTLYNCVAVLIVFIVFYVIIVWRRWTLEKKHSK